MHVVILGCGVIGSLVGNSLAANGHSVLGVRRRARPEQTVDCPIMTGDIADAALYTAITSSMPCVDAVLLAANPGVRRGVDNGLAQAAHHVRAYFPEARLIYTGTTSVYGDAQGAGVDETFAIDRSNPVIAALMAIEDAVRQHPHAVILRATALIGPSRLYSAKKLTEAEKNRQPCQIAGDLDRPFSYLHEFDLVELCLSAITGGLETGLYNAAGPDVITVRDYYQSIATKNNITCSLVSDGSRQPSRWINAEKLQRTCGKTKWRSLTDLN